MPACTGATKASCGPGQAGNSTPRCPRQGTRLHLRARARVCVCVHLDISESIGGGKAQHGGAAHLQRELSQVWRQGGSEGRKKVGMPHCIQPAATSSSSAGTHVQRGAQPCKNLANPTPCPPALRPTRISSGPGGSCRPNSSTAAARNTCSR